MTEKTLKGQRYRAKHSKDYLELDGLGIQEDFHVRKYVASNKNTGRKTLSILSNCSAPSIRKAVTWHPNVSVDILIFLSCDKDVDVRGGVASNPETPSTILATLSRDPSMYVRGCVAGNPTTSVNTLQSMIRMNDKAVVVKGAEMNLRERGVLVTNKGE